MSGNQPPYGPQNSGQQPNQGGMGPGPQLFHPQQGYPPQPPTKKKRTGCLIAALVVVVVVVAVLASCINGLNNVASGPNVAPAAGGGTTTSKSQSPPTEYAVGQPIQIDDVVLTVNSGEDFPPPNQYTKPQPGKVYYKVNLTLENKGSTPISYNAFDYKIEDANGVQNSYAFVTDVPNQLQSGSLAPGGKLNDANLAFEVPSGKNGLKLVMEPSVWSTKQVKVKLTD